MRSLGVESLRSCSNERWNAISERVCLRPKHLNVSTTKHLNSFRRRPLLREIRVSAFSSRFVFQFFRVFLTFVRSLFVREILCGSLSDFQHFSFSAFCGSSLGLWRKLLQVKRLMLSRLWINPSLDFCLNFIDFLPPVWSDLRPNLTPPRMKPLSTKAHLLFAAICGCGFAFSGSLRAQTSADGLANVATSSANAGTLLDPSVTPVSGGGGGGDSIQPVPNPKKRDPTFFWNGTGDVTDVNSWTNSDGSGTHPTNFTTAAQVFEFQGGQSATLTSAWTVSGANSRVALDTGATFNVGSNNPNIKITLAAGSNYLTANSYNNLNLVTASPTSVFEYDGTVGGFRPSLNYGSLRWSPSNLSATMVGDFTTTGFFTVATNAAVVIGNTGSTNSTWTVGTDLTVNSSANLAFSSATSTSTGNGEMDIGGGLVNNGSLSRGTSTRNCTHQFQRDGDLRCFLGKQQRRRRRIRRRDWIGQDNQHDRIAEQWDRRRER